MARHSNSMNYVEPERHGMGARAVNTQFLHTSYLFTSYCRRSIDFALPAFSNTTHCNSTSVVYFPDKQSTNGPGSMLTARVSKRAVRKKVGCLWTAWAVSILPGQSSYSPTGRQYAYYPGSQHTDRVVGQYAYCPGSKHTDCPSQQTGRNTYNINKKHFRLESLILNVTSSHGEQGYTNMISEDR